jgi:hypothetical protein
VSEVGWKKMERICCVGLGEVGIGPVVKLLTDWLKGNENTVSTRAKLASSGTLR